MSAFAAILTRDGSAVSPGEMDTMVQAMAHMGADSSAIWGSGSVSIGFCAQHDTAESLTAGQPLANEDGSIIVALDGYLGNCDDVRHSLLQRGAILRNQSDAELVLRAYEAWGQDCAQHFQGEYALVIYDKRQHLLFVTRDHQGFRPVHYWIDDRRVIIATTIAAIIAVLDDHPAPNLPYLAEVLTGSWYTDDETVWQGIRRLPAAHAMVATPSGTTVAEYWQLPLETTLTYRRDEDYVEHYRTLLQDCVRRASRTHKPLAYEVSGGLDSSALFAVAHHLNQSGDLLAPSIAGYTLAGPPGTAADEIAYARQVGEWLGVPLHEAPLFMPPLDWFSELARSDQSLPILPNTAMSLNLQQAMKAHGSACYITGLGGDQWLDGSPFYYSQFLRRGDVARCLSALAQDRPIYGWKHSARLLLFYGISPLLPPAIKALGRPFRGVLGMKGHGTAIIGPPLQPDVEGELRDREERYKARLPRDRLQRMKFEKLRHPYFSAMLDQDALYLGLSGMDARHPMMDREFITFSASTPEHIRLHNGVTKHVHRQAMAGLLPDAVRNRFGKAEFSAAYQPHHQRLCDLPIAPLFATLADVAAVRQKLHQFRTAPIDSINQHGVWGIYVVNEVLRLAALAK